jgi:ACR3 family arsenite transporter
VIVRLATILAARGSWLLVAGLVVGLAAPGLAQKMRPAVEPMVVALLFLAVLRMGPEVLRVGRVGLSQALLLAGLLQLALPLGVALLLLAAGLLEHPLALATILILAAAPITGAAHFAVMAGGDPALALRQTIIGTAVLPLTVLPIWVLIPTFGSAAEVVGAVLGLLAIIICAAGVALALRQWEIVPGTLAAMRIIDAIAALMFGVVVIGMLGTAGATLHTQPAEFAAVMMLACILCFGLQGATRLHRNAPTSTRPALAVVAGNRNAALFLSVLPVAVADDVLLLIGCYQVPMYLTPLVLPWLLRLGAPSPRQHHQE